MLSIKGLQEICYNLDPKMSVSTNESLSCRTKRNNTGLGAEVIFIMDTFILFIHNRHIFSHVGEDLIAFNCLTTIMANGPKSMSNQDNKQRNPKYT